MNCMMIVLSCLGAGCVSATAGQPAKLTVSSDAFAQGRAIPSRHTCQGADISPALKWESAPANTKSFALICDDPDAPGGTWVHWVLYNLPADAVSLAERTPKSAALGNGARQGRNSFRNIGYGGPCPPPGGAHRYFFKLYALDVRLSLEGAPTKEQLLQAMTGHILAQGELMGTYQRE